ncbi:MAG: WYL domain-containing transcriptional regulator [Clostridia bacterium]|nr:WYL domain-containing transcriptional regulator [Clostridia bacterium]
MGKDTQKIRILFLQDIFVRRSDENNAFSAEDLCDILLEDYNIKVERKAIYGDIEALKEYGLDIVNVRTPKRGYYLKGRKFEMAEVRLLTDAVLAAKFISPQKTKSLVYKIGSLASEGQEEKLRKQVYVNSTVKCDNEELYEVISTLHKAIERKVQVQFDYSKRVLQKRYVRKTESKTFIVNPYALIWSNDHYYLVCNNPKYSNLMHVRLDRISNIHITGIKCRHFSAVSKYKDNFDSADYSNRLFNMFSGESGNVLLRCSNDIIEEILERFGENVPIKIDDENHFVVKANVELSDGLVSWVMQFGERIEVLNPHELKKAIKDKAKLIYKIYE